MNSDFDPDLDLELARIIRAPRSAVWRAWTDSGALQQWFIPAPAKLQVERLEARPGGDAVFLVVEENARLVWTNAIDSRWRPQSPQPVALAAEISFLEHPEGTDYRVVVRHGRPEDRQLHADLGFFEGWGTVTEQLAALVE